jgi:hypothetical protein
MLSDSPSLEGKAEQLIGAGISPDRMAQLGLQLLVAPDAESPTGDSWVYLQNRAEADKLMQRAAMRINRTSPGAARLIQP